MKMGKDRCDSVRDPRPSSNKTIWTEAHPIGMDWLLSGYSNTVILFLIFPVSLDSHFSKQCALISWSMGEVAGRELNL